MICLLQGITKPLLWFGGQQATGWVSLAERGVSRSGAFWVEYNFRAGDQRTYTGTAMAGGNRDSMTLRKVSILYLQNYPELNMPANGGYAALMGAGWALLGGVLAGSGWILRCRRAHKRTTEKEPC